MSHTKIRHLAGQAWGLVLLMALHGCPVATWGGVQEEVDTAPLPGAADDAPPSERALAQQDGGFHSGDTPPWSLTGDSPRLLADPFANPRQLLRLLDIGESQLNAFADGQAMGEEDQEALIRILYRLPQIGLDSICRWQKSTVPWDELIDAPAAARASYFLLRGRIQQVQKHELPPRLSELFGFDHYYRAVLRTENPAQRLILCTREIPRSWLDREGLDERARASAMFLKLGPTADGVTELFFAAQRVAWLPDRVEPKAGIQASHVLLGDLDADVSLFEYVAKRNRLPIGESERECFYQLLAAVRKATPAQLADVTQSLELGPLLQAPERWHGRVVEVRGTVRRVTQVLVDEPDIRERFGVNSYYQLDVLVPLGEQRIEFQNKQGKVEGPVYQNSFPFTFCVAELPPAWQEFVGDSRVHEPMVARGYFFKLWSYPSDYVAAYDERSTAVESHACCLAARNPHRRARRRSNRWMDSGRGLSGRARNSLVCRLETQPLRPEVSSGPGQTSL